MSLVMKHWNLIKLHLGHCTYEDSPTRRTSSLVQKRLVTAMWTRINIAKGTLARPATTTVTGRSTNSNLNSKHHTIRQPQLPWRSLWWHTKIKGAAEEINKCKMRGCATASAVFLIADKMGHIAMSNTFVLVLSPQDHSISSSIGSLTCKC